MQSAVAEEYGRSQINEFHIELYTDYKDPELEERLEDILDGASIFYEKSETWIESEKLYEVLYTFEMEANDG